MPHDITKPIARKRRPAAALKVADAEPSKRTPTKRRNKDVAAEIARGRVMVKKGEMLSVSGPKPTPIEEARKSQVLCVQDPWDAGVSYIVDRKKELDHGCRVVVEMDGVHGVSYLPGVLATKHPQKAKSLEVKVTNFRGGSYGPLRGCRRADTIRIVAIAKDI